VLFSGAPHFNSALSAKGGADTLRPCQPAFSAATLHKHTAKASQPADERKRYQGYETDTVELPSMLDAQGIEPGSIGFRHFLELPKSDSLVTDLEDSQSGKGFLQGTKNKELLQSAPERIGIRAVDMSLVYDRLIEFQDLYEAFHDSPEPMTISNNQSAGDLYANLFSRFLMPPGYDGSGEDPTGLRIQIVTLLRMLRLEGIWYDFSLVEWRIRLGQILWSEPEPLPEHEPHPLWTEREVLLLQITLACELLLRLDAITVVNESENGAQSDVSQHDIHEFFRKKSKKIDWDLVLARRFLDNILVVKNGGTDEQTPMPKSRGFLGMFTGDDHAPDVPRSDVILLPQHQSRQLAGLLEFAEQMRWPNTDTILQDFTRKLGIRDNTHQAEQLPSPDGMLLDPISPASISVYGTPLQTPRAAHHMLDGYFGHVGKPALKRDNSRSFRIPLSSISSPLVEPQGSALTNVGGWLSRSYLTGLVLPGEAISHFLISTLLENDQAAIASLGDSANLYGGFTYAGRTWWSKNSVVGRVFACVEGSTECMGWISFPTPPVEPVEVDGPVNCWHSIHSEQLPRHDRLSDTSRPDIVAQDSAIIPNWASIRSQDLVLPTDAENFQTSLITFAQWELTPLNQDLMDSDMLSGPPTESDVHVPSLAFASQDTASTHTLTLSHDVHFITSWPCIPPTATSAPGLPHILRRSLTSTISRASSKRSESTARLNRRNSHGYEPLLSHPPDSTDIAPKRMYNDDNLDEPTISRQPMTAHPLHASYKYKVVPVSDVLDPEFDIPFDGHVSKPLASSLLEENGQEDAVVDVKKTVLVLDARSSPDLQLLARAWCAERGIHAIIGRVGRTCLACCIREARGLGINVVIRV
jgi:hypothetical protein